MHNTHTQTHRNTHWRLRKICVVNGLNQNNHPTWSNRISQTIYCLRISLSFEFRISSFESFSLLNFYLNILSETIAHRGAITWNIQNWSAVDFHFSFIEMPLHLKRQLKIFDTQTKMCVEWQMISKYNENMKFRAKQFEIGDSFWGKLWKFWNRNESYIRIGNACNGK